MKNQLTQFDRTSVRALAESIEQALQAVGNQYGVEIKRGSGRFDAGEFKLSLHCTVLAGATERKNENDRLEFELYAYRYGLTGTDFGRTFTSGDTTYTIVGVKPKSKRFPIICERADGKRFKMTALTVKSHLPQAQA